MEEHFPCGHEFRYQGIVYSYDYQLAGSGAYTVKYEDRYYCTKCLAVKDANPRIRGNSYEKPIQGSVPK